MEANSREARRIAHARQRLSGGKSGPATDKSDYALLMSAAARCFLRSFSHNLFFLKCKKQFKYLKKTSHKLSST
jgi:hypothetical protein